jgi:zinc-binding alcohol dehydrogenase family protein
MTPSTMRVQGLLQLGSADLFQELEIARPEPGPSDLLVRVLAAGLNPVDMKLRSGAGTSGSTGTPKVDDPPLVLGFDACGVVEGMGSEVRGFEVGDRVWYAGVTGRQGSYAQVQCVDHRIASLAPKTLGDHDAAVFPLASLTVWESLLEQLQAGASTGAHLLVTGGAGGVGSLAIPFAKRVLGLRVTATASREETRAWCLARGADAVVDHTLPLKDQLPSAPDFILHTGSDTMVPELLDLLAPLGRICVIAGGPTLKALDVTPLIAKRGTLTFELMFTRARLGLDPHRQGQILSQIAELADSGILPSPLTRTFAWGDLPEGHRVLESRRAIGKLSLEIPS